MSSLLGIHSLSKSYGTQILFKNISFTIMQNDRIGLFGPNGCGKSTFLKILMNLEKADDGHISRRQQLRVGYASQDPVFPSMSLEELLVKEISNDKHDYEALTRARILLGKACFSDFEQDASKLSGGWKKRLDILRALMPEPDLLLLDEPTNHLDLEGILWLEKFLMREKIAYLAVSHDRYFLENIANRTIELNRCYPEGIFISEGGMEKFYEHRDAFLAGQLQQERGLASVVRNEVEWLRKSPKARTTKSRSRIQKANELIDELSDIQQRNKVRKVGIEFSASDRETRKLLVGKNLTKVMGDQVLFKGLDIVLSPGSRLGIVGKNGTGKTTLLKVLSGAVTLDQGTIKYAEGLSLVYFDQHREHLPPNISLRRALSPTNDTVNYRGQLIHVNGWAEKFLFSKDRLELPVGCLSGGERARILIAKLMLQPADILFLDEPTNDLDISTLEVIEESLMDFPGAVVLISHDRYLMDKVCTQVLSLGVGQEPQFYADYSQLEAAATLQTSNKEASTKKTLVTPPATAGQEKTVKLSYREQRELDGMEHHIALAEKEVQYAKDELEDPQMASNAQKSLLCYQKLADAEKKLETLFLRWQELLDKSTKRPL